MADVRTNIRLPEELYEAIKQLAGRDLRSINSQMVVLLQEAVTARQAEETPDPAASSSTSRPCIIDAQRRKRDK